MREHEAGRKEGYADAEKPPPPVSPVSPRVSTSVKTQLPEPVQNICSCSGQNAI